MTVAVVVITAPILSVDLSVYLFVPLPDESDGSLRCLITAIVITDFFFGLYTVSRPCRLSWYAVVAIVVVVVLLPSTCLWVSRYAKI